MAERVLDTLTNNKLIAGVVLALMTLLGNLSMKQAALDAKVESIYEHGTKGEDDRKVAQARIEERAEQMARDIAEIKQILLAQSQAAQKK